jgi:hypothetical protein
MTFLRLSYDFLMTFLRLSYDFLPTFLRLSYDFLTTFLRLSYDFLMTNHEVEVPCHAAYKAILCKLFYTMVTGSSTVVVYVTRNPQIEGLNPVNGTRRKKFVIKINIAQNVFVR